MQQSTNTSIPPPVVPAAVPVPPPSTAATVGPSWPVDYNAYKLLGKVGQGAFATVWRAECTLPSSNNHNNINSISNNNNDVRNDATTSSVDTSMAVETTTPKEDDDNNNDVVVKKEEEKILCAIKILDLEHVDTNFGDIRLEVQTMRLSSHPNILSIYTSFIQSSNLWLVMQLMNKGSSLHCLQSIRMKYKKDNNHNDKYRQQQHDTNYLNDMNNKDNEIKKKKQQEIIMENHITYILYETLLGLKYIHENGQIHRDVKAGNILLDSFGNVRIADFGVSGWLVHGGSKRENTRTFVGTPCWMAPEVMEQIHGYDTKADIWSLGITALELAKGYAPYAKYAPMKVLLLTIQEDPPSLDTYLKYDDGYNSNGEDDCDDNNQDIIMNEDWSQSFRSLINMCLQKSPNERPNCEELLQHDHFKPLLDDNKRIEYRNRIKLEICDQIDNVGRSKTSETVGEIQSLQSQRIAPPSEPYLEGTTWVFENGSQVSSRLAASDDGDLQDFLNKFEKSTGGENYKINKTNQANDKDKDDINAFMDELETFTSGENFKK